jgi:hypothetical protein
VRGGGCDAFRIHFRAPADAPPPRALRGEAAPNTWGAGFREGPSAREGCFGHEHGDTAEPGIQPVTFRAMFIEELRARREVRL